MPEFVLGMAQWFMALLESIIGLRIFSQDNAGSDDSLPFSSSSEGYADGEEDYLQPSAGCYRDAVRSLSPIVAGGVGRSSQLSSSSGSNSSISSMAYGLFPHVTHSSSQLTVLEYVQASAVRQLACQMVRGGFTLTLIGAFDRGEPDALERWFYELDVVEALGINVQGGALRLPDGDEFQLPHWVSSWTLALVVMSEALSATQRQPRGTPAAVSGAGTATGTTLASDDGLRLARFADASVSRMLEFADAVAAVDLKHRSLTEKLLVLLNLHAHVSKASEILLPSLLDESGWPAASHDMNMMRSLVNKIDEDLSARKERLSEVMWRVMQDAKALISSKDSWDTMPQDGEIHETTELTMEFATMLRANESVLNSIVWRFSESWHQTSTANIIADLIGELEEQLEAESESSLMDPSVRYIFLLNNCDFIEQRLLDFPSGRVFGKYLSKLERYLKNYMDASWEPVLSCLQGNGATTTWFQIQNQCSPLVKFQSKLEATCRAQMMWKVPNPTLRQRLREAITKKVVGAYNDYLEAQKRGHGELCSSEGMEEMLNELFEG